jgi:RHS repeat-associated protein
MLSACSTGPAPAATAATTSSNRRYYGTNAHHDVTWLADSAGAVSASLRYDPWGTPRSTVPTGYTPFRFQGSWYDATTDLAWVVTRWYAPSLGRFVSEDSLLGEPRHPDSRHLYAYAAGEPVGAWDPDGQYWYVTRSGDSLGSIAQSRLNDYARFGMILNANRGRKVVGDPAKFYPSTILPAGKCWWIPWQWISNKSASQPTPARCSGLNAPKVYKRINRLWGTEYLKLANDGSKRLGISDFRMITPQVLNALTLRYAGRYSQDQQTSDQIEGRVALANVGARFVLDSANNRGTRVYPRPQLPNTREICNNSILPSSASPNAYAFTLGQYVFYTAAWCPTHDGAKYRAIRSHEYIHTLQFENFGSVEMLAYLGYEIGQPYHGSPSNNPYEAIGYIWEGWTMAYRVASWERYWPYGG